MKSPKNKLNTRLGQEFKPVDIELVSIDPLFEGFSKPKSQESGTFRLDVDTVRSMTSGTCIIPSNRKEGPIVVCKEGKRVKIFRLVSAEHGIQTWKELIDNARDSCTDLVFKEVCLDILSKARNTLTAEQFKRLVDYVAQKMQEGTDESKEVVTVGAPENAKRTQGEE